MPTQDEINAAQDRVGFALAHIESIIDRASESIVQLEELKNFISGLTPDNEPAPEPDPWPIPQNVVGSSTTNSIGLTWEVPSTNRNITGIQVTYGYDGAYRGGEWTVDGPVDTYVIESLPSGKTISVDVGFRVDGVNPSKDQLVRVTLDTKAPVGPEPTDPGGFPASGTWADKEAWIKSVAGPAGELAVVNSAASAADTGLPITWSDAWGGILVHEPCILQGLDIAGQIVLNSGAGHAVQIIDVAFKGLWSNGGHANYIERVKVTHRPHNLGQGALNALASDNVVKRADLSGFADGIQYRGRLHLVESYFHDAAYTSSTHNDDTQGYGGSSLLVERSLFDHSPPYLNVRNGHIFTNDPSPAGGDIVDSILRIRTNRASNWVANSHMGPFRYLRCRIDGKFGGAGHTTTDCEVTP